MAITHYVSTALIGGAAGALDAIDGAILNDEDRAFATLNNVFYLYQLDATSGAAESSPDIITPDANPGTKRWILQDVYSETPKKHITGLVLSNDADTAHDINITAGEARDSTNAVDLVLASEITKQIDVGWAVGDDDGGLFAGAVAANTIYHVFLIKRSDTGVVDAGFDIDPAAANIPANYDYYRWIGYVLTD